MQPKVVDISREIIRDKTLDFYRFMTILSTSSGSPLA